MEQQKKKHSLVELLRIMQDFDDGCSNLNFEQFKEIVGDLVPEKVDNCKSFLMNIEARINVIDEEIKELQSSKKSLKSSIENYKKYLAYAMESTGCSKIPGKKHVLYLAKKKTIKPKNFEITAETYMNFNTLKPGTIERTYKINASKFKSMCENSHEMLNKYADEQITTFTQFRANKEL